jgi:putative ABC transport system permease protein
MQLFFICPQFVYKREFSDGKLAKYYELNDTILKLIEFFSGVAILIGCLGLYGLVSFMLLFQEIENLN